MRRSSRICVRSALLPLASCLVASRSTGRGPPPKLPFSTHTWAFLACPQSTSCRCGSNSVACLDGSHCAPHGTPSSSDWDTAAGSSALVFRLLSLVTSSPLLYHPFLESLPRVAVNPQLNFLACVQRSAMTGTEKRAYSSI